MRSQSPPTLWSLVDLVDRRAIVTGAAQGFGAAIARRLAEAGATVVVADLNAGAAEKTAAEIATATDGTCVGRGVDVTDEAAVADLFDGVEIDHGDVSILVNNAGVFSNYLARDMPVAEFERILRVNVTGGFICAREAARRMVPREKGTIVNVASVDAMRPSAEGLLHYTTSKHGIAGLTRSLAMELGPYGIRVNAVCPGAAMTEGAVEFIQAGAPEGIDLEEQWDGIVERTPLGRLCDPDDVARAALFLACDLAQFVTGILLPVDGGILTQPLEGYVHHGDE